MAILSDESGRQPCAPTKFRPERTSEDPLTEQDGGRVPTHLKQSCGRLHQYLEQHAIQWPHLFTQKCECIPVKAFLDPIPYHRKRHRHEREDHPENVEVRVLPIVKKEAFTEPFVVPQDLALARFW